MIKNDEYSFKVNSNGLLLEDRRIADALIDYNIGLQVSIDGPAQIHDRYRVDINGKPSFARILNNLRYLKKRDPEYYKKNVNFQATLAIDSDLSALNDFFEREELIDANRCAITLVKFSDTTFYERFNEYNYAQYDKQHQVLTENYIRRRIMGQEPKLLGKMLFDKSLSLFHIRMLNEPYDTIGLNGTCIPGLRKLFVNTDGRFYPCERVMTAYNIGDVDNGLEIDKILAVAHNYKDNSEADCINCWGAKICGICFLHAEKNSHFDLARKREKCARMLKSKHNDLVIYSTIMEKNPKAFDFTKKMKFA